MVPLAVAGIRRRWACSSIRGRPSWTALGRVSPRGFEILGGRLRGGVFRGLVGQAEGGIHRSDRKKTTVSVRSTSSAEWLISALNRTASIARHDPNNRLHQSRRRGEAVAGEVLLRPLGLM